MLKEVAFHFGDHNAEPPDESKVAKTHQWLGTITAKPKAGVVCGRDARINLAMC